MDSLGSVDRGSVLLSFLASIPREVRLAARSLAKSPGFSLLALVTLALGIGANTATFSVVNAVLLKRLPYPQPERLVEVKEVGRLGGEMNAAWPNFRDWQEHGRKSHHFDSLAAYAAYPATVLGGERPVVAQIAVISRDFFSVLGVHPRLGRTANVDEHRTGALPVAVVSHSFFTNEMGGDAKSLGHREIDVEGRRYLAVGVMPPGFAFPAKTEAWLPVELDEMPPYRTAHNFQVVGRLSPPTTPSAATRELAALTATFKPFSAEEGEEYLAKSAVVRPLREAMTLSMARPLWMLLGASGLVLLIACANLASGLLARGAGRSEEMAVRRALGASTSRLMTQLLVESLLLSLTGAALGLGLGEVAVRLLPRLAPAAMPRLDEIGLDGRVLAFTVLVAILTSILFGLVPTLRLVRNPERKALAGGRLSADRERQRSWKTLVAAEVALALVLAISSGLLIRSLGRLLAVDLGFSPAAVTTARLDLPASRFAEKAQVAAFYDALLDDLAARPLVAAVGVVNALPLAEQGSNGEVAVTGAAQETADIEYRVASRGYFAAMEIATLRGRTFSSEDRADVDQVVVIDKTMAETIWRGRDPIGQRIDAQGMDEYFGTNTWATVIGVVDAVRDRSLAGPPRPTAYFCLAQRPRRAMSASLVVRGRSDRDRDSSLATTIRGAVSDVGRGEVPAEIATLKSTISESVRDRRFTLTLLVVFAALAFGLALVGIAGVVAYSVAERRREIAVRVAIGATPSSVRALVVKNSLAAVGLGIALGLLGALAVGRLLRAGLFEIAATDPSSYAFASLLLLAAAGLASYGVAERTTRIDPMTLLRRD